MITGPSGVGKGTLIRGLLARVPRARAVGLGDDAARRGPGERDGVDYHFLTPEEFERARRAGRLRRARHLLGQPLRDAALGARASARAGRPGRARDRGAGRSPGPQAMPEAIAVFIAPPSREALRTRLVGRGTDTAEQVDERMRTAERELEAQSEFAPRRRQRPARGRDRRARADRARRAARSHGGHKAAARRRAPANLWQPDPKDQKT